MQSVCGNGFHLASADHGDKGLGFSMKPRGCVIGQGFDIKNLLNPQSSLDRNPNL